MGIPSQVPGTATEHGNWIRWLRVSTPWYILVFTGFHIETCCWLRMCIPQSFLYRWHMVAWPIQFIFFVGEEVASIIILHSTWKSRMHQALFGLCWCLLICSPAEWIKIVVFQLPTHSPAEQLVEMILEDDYVEYVKKFYKITCCFVMVTLRIEERVHLQDWCFLYLRTSHFKSAYILQLVEWPGTTKSRIWRSSNDPSKVGWEFYREARCSL